MERKQSKKVNSLRANSVSGNRVNKESSSKNASYELEVRRLLSDQVFFRKGLVNVNVPIPRYRCIRRFKFGTNFSGNLIMSDGHNQFLVGLSSTSVGTYIDMWRIRKITAYLRNNEADYNVQLQLTPGGSDTSNFINGVPKMYALESQSSAEASILVLKPSTQSPLGMWHRTNTTNASANLLSVATTSGGGSIDANSMLDIEFEFIPNFIGTPGSYTVTALSGIVVGELYGGSICAGLILPLNINVAL